MTLRQKWKKREIRLRTKAQKAGCLRHIIAILQDNDTWNRRFGEVQRRRAHATA